MSYLTLDKQNSILNGLEMIEYLPKSRIKAIIISGILLNDWGSKFNYDLNKQKVREHYANEIIQLKAYLKQYNKNIGGIKIKYTRFRSCYGRVYNANHYGFTSFRRVVRNSLILDLYYDFDLKSAHQAITLSLCKKNNIYCPEIEKYVNYREYIINETCDIYGVDEDLAKDLFIRLNFGGSFDKWVDDNKINNLIPTAYIVSYQREVKDIADKLKKHNKSLWEIVKGKKIKEEDALRSFFALYLQEWEQRIVAYVLNYLINSTKFMKHPVNNIEIPVGSYEYDGFKLLKENVDNNGGIQEVLNIIHTKTAEFGFPDLIWTNKQYKEFIDLTEWISVVDTEEMIDEEFLKVIDEIEKIVLRTDIGIIELIKDNYPNHFVYSLKKGDNSNQGIWYCWDGNRWRSNDIPLRNVITYDVEKILRKKIEPFEKYKFEPIDDDDEPNSNEELYIKLIKVLNNIISKITSSCQISGIINAGKQVFTDYKLEFDMNPYLFGFENGVLDIETKTFRPYKFDDKSTFSTNYDFTPYNKKLYIINKDNERVNTNIEMDEINKKAYERVNEFMEQILTDPNERTYVKTIQASGMVGICIQLFNVYNGNGRNGKGILNDFTRDAYGDYAVAVSSTIFTEVSKSSSNSNPELAKIDKKRLITTREPPKDIKLQNSSVKDKTGGGEIQGRFNHSNNTIINLHNTTIMECNSKPDFAETPETADIERIRDVLFKSYFTDVENEVDNITIFKRDDTLKLLFKKTEYKNALINILLDNLFELHDANYNITKFTPESISVRSLEYLNKSNDICNLFEEVFELRKEGGIYVDKDDKPYEGDWTLSAISSIIRSGKTEFYTLPKKKQKEITKDKIIEFFKTNKIYKRNIYENGHTKQIFLKGYGLKEKKDESD